MARHVVLAALGASSDWRTLDLARSGTREEQVQPGTYHLVIKNRAPGVAYAVSVGLEPLSLPPLEVPPVDMRKRPPEDPCRPLEAAVNALVSPDLKAGDVAATASTVQEEQNKVAGQCDAESQRAQEALLRTTEDLGDRELPQGHVLTLTVKRSNPESTWSLALKTAPAGQWFTTYGFSFAWDRDRRYYSKAAEGGTYTVTREASPRGPVYIPTIFFGWMPASRLGRTLQYSPVGGMNLSLIAAVGACRSSYSRTRR